MTREKDRGKGGGFPRLDMHAEAVKIDGQWRAIATARLFDGKGNPLPGEDVAFSMGGAPVTFVKTNQTGAAETSLPITGSRIVNVSAKVGGREIANSVHVKIPAEAPKAALRPKRLITHQVTKGSHSWVVCTVLSEKIEDGTGVPDVVIIRTNPEDDPPIKNLRKTDKNGVVRFEYELGDRKETEIVLTISGTNITTRLVLRCELKR